LFNCLSPDYASSIRATGISFRTDTRIILLLRIRGLSPSVSNVEESRSLLSLPGEHSRKPVMGIICGWFGSQDKNSQPVIEAMLRGAVGLPQASDAHYASERAALGFHGHIRIAPVYRSEDICAVIEGTPKWRDAQLEQLSIEKGHTCALVEGFRQHGRKVLDRPWGEFALCLLKPDEGYALLAVDRTGIRPLAYAISDGILLFGSQIGGILAHPAARSEINPQGIFNYLYFHMVPSPGTLYKGIEKLQPGEYVEYSGGKLRRGFHSPLHFSEDRVSQRNLAAQLKSEPEESVEACVSDGATGTFLSGGLDSSTVTGVYQSLSRERIDAFAIGFDAEGFDEMEYARATANHFGVSLHEYYVTPADVLEAIPLVASACDEPFGNASAIPAYFCARFAREAGKACLLAGDGGDEIFAGNARYAKQKVFDLYNHVPPALREKLIEPLVFNLPVPGKLKSYIEQANIPMPERMEAYNFLHRTPLDEIFDRDFLKQIDVDAPIDNLRSRYECASTDSLVKKMLFLDHKFTLADNDLRKVNRMCELAGIEVRYPLLQDNMMDFAARVPTRMLMRGYELRSFFRHSMKDFLPKETLSKHKHGFGLPFGLWLHDYAPLREFADDKLHKIKQRAILNDRYIDQMIQAHQTGHATYYGVMIWILVMLEQWLELHQQAAS